MIRMRIDDIMWVSTESKYAAPGRSFQRVRAIHGWCNDSGGQIMHVPTVICHDIDDWPEVVEWMRHETVSGKMEPAIHGWHHIDYAELTEQECYDHLKLCLEWFKDTLWFQPTVWATPWGADSASMQAAAKRHYLKLETTRFTIEPGPCMKRVRQTGNANCLADTTIMDHWWKMGNHIYRIAEVCKHGTLDAAVQWDRDNRDEPIFKGWSLSNEDREET